MQPYDSLMVAIDSWSAIADWHSNKTGPFCFEDSFFDLQSELDSPANPGLSRSMSRSARLLSQVWLRNKGVSSKLTRTAESRRSVYLAVDHEFSDLSVLVQLEKSSVDVLHRDFAKQMNPRSVLRNQIHVVAGALSIQLNAKGGVHTFCHPEGAVLHAIYQALLDLAEEKVELAVIGSAVSWENSALIDRHRSVYGSRSELVEAAGFLILQRAPMGAKGEDLVTQITQAKELTDWKFGVASPLMSWMRSKNE